MMLEKQASHIREGITSALEMPVRQATMIAGFAALVALVALLIAIRKTT